MFNILSMSLLGLILFAPLLLLSQPGAQRSQHWFRLYLLGVSPALVTGLGWQFSHVLWSIFECQGSFKDMYSCHYGSIDTTALVGFTSFLSVPFLYLAIPISLWLTGTTLVRQIQSLQKQKKAGISPTPL